MSDHAAPTARFEGAKRSTQEPIPLTEAETGAITAHLTALGLLPFEGPDGAQRFYTHVQERLGQERCDLIDKRRRARGLESISTLQNDLQFYALFEDDATARSLLSTRFDYFRETGPRVLKHLPETGRFLDLGAGAGILTNYYARHRPGCEFFGVDRAPEPVKIAKKDARTLGLTNVKYDVADVFRLVPGRDWDGVISTTGFWRRVLLSQSQARDYQNLTSLAERGVALQHNANMQYNARILHNLYQVTKPDGILIAMERIEDAVNAEAWRILHLLAGWEEKEFEVLSANDEGRLMGFGLAVMSRGVPKQFTVNTPASSPVED